MSTKREKLKNQLKLLESIEVSTKHDLKENVKLLINTRRGMKNIKKKLAKLEGENV